VTGQTTTTREASTDAGAQRDSQSNYGLQANALGPVETLAQSVSAVAPSTTPSLTIPLVFALAGNATWFVYLLATGAIVLIGYCVSRFARLSASPGSLYTYTAETLPHIFGVVAAWGLLLAYLATGASVAGGALYYATIFSGQISHAAPLAVVLLAAVCAAAGYIAWRDVRLSAEFMLWIEAVSVSLIVIVLAFMPLRFGLHLDLGQFRFSSFSFSSLGPALVLSIFSFVGFESATALGSEAREPLRTIPRAVLQCALLIGAFFMLCAYSEVLGFRSSTGQLSATTSPLHLLAVRAGVSALGVAIDCGVMVSMFACVLACITAASRVLLHMARSGLISAAFQHISRHRTPDTAIALCVLMMFAATGIAALRGTTGSGMYDIFGSLSVFGFLTAYALVAVALPFAHRALGQHSRLITAASILTVLVIVLIVVFDIESATDPLHARLPCAYLAYLGAGTGWYMLRRRPAEG
jgi:amino acid transporter